MRLLGLLLVWPLAAADLILPDAVERQGMVDVTFRANSMVTGKGEFSLRWTDVHNRVVEDWTRAVELVDENEIRFRLDARRVRAMKNTLEARLVAAGKEHSAKRDFIGRPENTDWWDYIILMWNRYSARDVATLKTMGINAGQIVGNNQPPPPFLADNDLRWYAENIATDFYAAYHRYFPDRPKTYLFREAKELYARDPSSKEAFKRLPSLSDQAWLDRVAERVEKAVRMQKPWGPVFYSLGDESGIADLTAYWDFDFSDHSLTAMRPWLRERYGTLGALNRQWGADFKSWDRVIPETTNEAMKRADGNWSSWADHKDWMDEAFARALKVGADAAHRADPHAFVGIGGAQMPGWGGYDYARLAEVLNAFEPYDIGNNIEIIRSLAPATPVVTTSFAKGPWEKHRVWYELLHGNRGMLIWDEANEFIDKSGQVADRGAAAAAYYKELRGGIASQLMNSRRVADPIAIHYSQASMRTEWMKQHQPKGEAWLRRGASTERMDSDFLRARESWCRLVEDLGLQYNFVSYRQLEKGELARGGYRVLILPRSSSLSELEAAEIKAFAERGGVVLADIEPGTHDEHSRKLEQSRIGGVRVTRADPDFLNYHQLRLLGKEEPIRERLRALISLSPAIKVTDAAGAAVTGVELHTFVNGGATIAALHTNPQLRVNELGPPEFKSNERFEKARSLRVSLPGEMTVVDLRSGKAMGRLRQWTVTLDPYEPQIFAIFPHEPPKLAVAAQAQVALGANAEVVVSTGDNARHVIHTETVSPNGQIVPHYSGNLLARHGAATRTIPLAKNDSPGKWTVRLRDILTGQTATVTFEAR